MEHLKLQHIKPIIWNNISKCNDTSKYDFLFILFTHSVAYYYDGFLITI